MTTRMTYGNEARRLLKLGIDQLADTLKPTLGPRGRSVILQGQGRYPTITNDGAQIAKAIEIPQLEENMGSRLIRDAAYKTNAVVGDGTTTSVVLAQTMLHECMRCIAAGGNVRSLQRGMAYASELAVSKIKNISVSAESRECIEAVATVSSGSEEIGRMVAEVFHKVGKDTLIMVEESRTADTWVETTEGTQFENGYMSPYMVTDKQRLDAILQDPYILVSDKKIGNIRELVPILEQVKKAQGTLLILADDIKSEALSALVHNIAQGAISCVCVKTPGVGDRRREMALDVAIMTGGQVVSAEQGTRFEDITLDMLGRARMVRVTKDSTLIMGSRGKQEEIQKRIKQIESLMQADSVTPYVKGKLEERIAHLAGGVGIIKIGAATGPEMKEKKKRTEKAIHAVRAALDGGVVPGGGIAYIRALKATKEQAQALQGDECVGFGIVIAALQKPLLQIAENAGLHGDPIIANVLESNHSFYGFDVVKGIYTDMMTAGILDPATVCCNALESAVSVASVFLTSEVLTSGCLIDPPPPMF